jgi:hypothetical protein
MSNFPVLKKFSILVFCDENILTPDVVEHAGKLWIVPQWLAAYDGTIRPLLMIRFDNLKHQSNALGKDYMLNQPLKKSVLDGTMLEGFETLSGSDVPIYSQENKSLH